jgi:tetratricopeptide (TPR) repeat protein
MWQDGATSPHDVTRYTRQDVIRILRLQPQQLSGWERSGLLAATDAYSFQDLSRIRTLRDLSAKRLSASSIRASINAMQQASGMINPLLEAGAVASGRRLVFRHSGMMMDPILGQFLFDFDLPQEGRLALVRAGRNARDPRDAEISQLFMEAVGLEEGASSSKAPKDAIKSAMRVYEQILSLQPRHAPAAINLGTLFYNQRQFGKAEELYRRATESDPNYALAFFDLGNVLDELQRLPEAVAAYRRAIALVPNYADAHYNLALAYERLGQPRRALRHWSTYVRLDPIGPWANHARGQIKKVLHSEPLTIVHRRATQAVELGSILA